MYFVRLQHELRPDRQCGARAFESEVTIVIETYPCDDQKILRVAGEPTVVRGAGFSGGRQCEATRTNFGAGAAIDHALHQIRHEKCELRVDDFDRLVFRRSDTGTTGPLNTANHMRIDMFPLVCESRIRSGQFNGCNFERA